MTYTTYIRSIATGDVVDECVAETQLDSLEMAMRAWGNLAVDIRKKSVVTVLDNPRDLVNELATIERLNYILKR